MVPRGPGSSSSAPAPALKRYLDPSCTYVASDLVQRGPDTFVCDLNRRPLPDPSALCTRTSPCSPGCWSTSATCRWSSRGCRATSGTAWLSYAVAAPGGLVRAARAGARRTYYGYMNSYSEADLVALFHQGGFACLRTDSWNDQRLFLFARAARGGPLMTSQSASSRSPHRPWPATRRRTSWTASTRPGSRRRGKYVDRFEADFAEFCGVRACASPAPTGRRRSTWPCSPSASGRATRSSCPP